MKNITKWKFNSPEFIFKNEINDVKEGWYGHRTFAYDLVCYLKPKTIVELGTYKGTSFLSFAQSVKDNKLNTRMFGIDTWEGDIHTGYYGKSVKESLEKIITKYFSKIRAELIQSTFNNALIKFKDKSIDILHIDGLHTYVAVKEDFNNWLPKVKEDGVVLLHDTHYKKRGFGVYKFWNEIKKDYKTIEMYHSNGLGILFLDEKKFNNIKNMRNYFQEYYSCKYMSEYLSRGLTPRFFNNLSLDDKELVLVNSSNTKEALKLTNLVSKNISLENQLEDIRASKFFKLWKIIMRIKEYLAFKS